MSCNKKLEELFQEIDQSTNDIINMQKMLTAIPAIAPESGGKGEYEKACALMDWLEQNGFENIETRNAPDHRVPSGERSNVIAAIPGSNPGRGGSFWIMSHLDVVPPGEMSGWVSEPFELRIEDDRLYGRGVEDNQQGLVSSVIAAKALMNRGITPSRDIKLLFVADEETGSVFGIQHLLKESDLFKEGDVFLVPDAGNSEGTMIEIAEKNALWLKFIVQGKQVHASTPDRGVNAFIAGSALVLRMKNLQKLFPQENNLFNPSFSTFSPTKKERNVPNINTIPGEDVFYMDCRIIPAVDTNDVLDLIRKEESAVESEYGVTIKHEIIHRVESSPTPEDSVIVQRLKESLKSLRQKEGKPTGIGGGTVAAYLRNAGYDTVVWATLDSAAHQENEYCRLSNLIEDAKIMAELMVRL